MGFTDTSNLPVSDRTHIECDVCRELKCDFVDVRGVEMCTDCAGAEKCSGCGERGKYDRDVFEWAIGRDWDGAEVTSDLLCKDCYEFFYEK